MDNGARVVERVEHSSDTGRGRSHSASRGSGAERNGTERNGTERNGIMQSEAQPRAKTHEVRPREKAEASRKAAQTETTAFVCFNAGLAGVGKCGAQTSLQCTNLGDASWRLEVVGGSEKGKESGRVWRSSGNQAVPAVLDDGETEKRVLGIRDQPFDSVGNGRVIKDRAKGVDGVERFDIEFGVGGGVVDPHDAIFEQGEDHASG
jgi:hypothetical protein